MKTYAFRFTLRKCQFTNGFTSIHYGGSDTVYHESQGEMTFKDATAHLQRLSESEPRPHYASIGMQRMSDRKPPGFNKARGIYSRGKQA